MSNLYQIEETSNIHPEQLEGVYLDPNWWNSFQDDKENFKKSLVENVKNKISLTILRLGHCEFRLLSNIVPGKTMYGGGIKYRHSLRSRLENREYVECYESIIKADVLSTQMGYDFKKWLNDCINFKNNYIKYGENIFDKTSLFLEDHKEYHQKELFDLPLEILYGFVANKWFFKTFKNKIGLIGAKGKLECIKDLMEFQEYKNYLGTDVFTDYIKIPQREGLDSDKLIQILENEIPKSSCDIFLIGAGSSKLKFFHKLKNIKNCIYIDVGHGIDLISGHGDISRPYCGSWKNYRIKNKNYDIDWMGGNAGELVFLDNYIF